MLGRRVQAWAWACMWLAWAAMGDEEDPLQHKAQVAARDRQLTRVLHTLGVEKSASEDNPDSGGKDDEGAAGAPGEACTHKTLDIAVPPDQFTKFQDGTRAALHIANLLNNLFVAVPEGLDPSYPPYVFYALVRAMMDNEPSIMSSAVAFQRGEFRSPVEHKTLHDVNVSNDEGILRGSQEDTTDHRQMFGAYAYRRDGEIGTTNLAMLYNQSYDQADVEGSMWFTAHLTYRRGRRRINATLTPEGSPSPSGALTQEEDGLWAPSPLYDCGASGAWVIAYSLPFFARAADGIFARLKGVVLVTFPLSVVDLNQCDDSDDILGHHLFGGTHKCDVSTTRCVPVAGVGFRRGGYRCQCRPNYFRPNTTHQYFNGTLVELAYSETRTLHAFRCWPCPGGCGECSASVTCGVTYDKLTRLVPVCVEAACVLVCLVLALVIFKIRKCRVIAASLWTMLEMVLLGAVVIYCTVFLRVVEPTALLCMLEPWCREVGFALFYGALVLKLYRNLVDYRTRKAHRYVIRDRDLLKYLAGLVVFITGYLAAWSALTAHLATEGHSPLAVGRTSEGLAFSVCKSVWWEYVTESGELLFIMFGLYLAWHLNKAARNSGDCSELSERRALTTALVLELVTSTTLYTGRHMVWLRAHPDHVFLAYFARTQLTITLSILLILTPKVWCAAGVGGQDLPRRTYSTTEGVQEPRFCDALTNGDLEASDINLSQMDPEEIRTELRRVYTQLEVLRTKTMRKDNPHISKRRGGRKATHRRFSLQSRTGSREKSFHRHHQRPLPLSLEGCEGDISKTPEESVCSIEGPSVVSVYADGPSDTGTPSILHRSYKL
ncbi:metabotropic glycine receptor isoform X1 [Procambarus clarkii]|uniref:metabotropic glycine receptor isoform X1 n=1 Tax=Procambarus clarkii TaxID=6728 RepID=UPI003742BF3F